MLNMNASYSFTTVSPTILGNSYKNMKVKALLSITEAIKYRDIVTLHKTLKTTIPTIPSIEDCTFILFENLNGVQTLLAYEWLNVASITTVTTMTINVSIFDADSDDLAIINNRLLELGYTNFTITTTNE